MNGPQASQKGASLQSYWNISENDHLYLIDNKENMEQNKRDINAIKIFIYGFYFIAIMVSICIIYNISLQYFLSKARDTYLLYTSGMTRKDISKQYIIQIMVISVISLCISFILLLGLNKLVSLYLNLNISFVMFLIQLIIYSIFLIVLLILVMKYIIKKYLNDIIEQNMN